MKFALETVNATRTVKCFGVVTYVFGIKSNIMWRKERNEREIRREICSKRRVKQAVQSNKGCDIAKGESDMKFIRNSDLKFHKYERANTIEKMNFGH